MPRRPRTLLRRLAGLALAGLALASAACEGRAATPEECEAILDRIVELELREQGYRDPALLARKQAEFRRLFADDLGRCVGRRLPPGARECVARASSAEAISHECLR
ncbi:MAG: hypothetical protein H6710_01795 [Myxococcales bacterium]|nr:hypothetical protein [Myxococcales bacterium]